MNILEHLRRIADITVAREGILSFYTSDGNRYISMDRYGSGKDMMVTMKFMNSKGNKLAGSVDIKFENPNEVVLEHTLSLALSWLTNTQVLAFSYITVGERFGYEGRSLMRIKQLPVKMGANAIDEETGDLRLIKDDWKVQALDRLA